MTEQTSKLPQFQTPQDEAKFWDTHDFTDFMDEMTPVDMKVAQPLSDVVTVRFDSHTLNSLRTQATKKGIGATSLIRMWVKERLSELKSTPFSKAAHQ